MSVREVTYYQVVCDEPGCGHKTGDGGSEYSAWAEPEGATIEWDESDGQVTDAGKHYCDRHRRRFCDACDELVEGDECPCGAS